MEPLKDAVIVKLIREQFSYNSETGELFRYRTGRIVGSPDVRGYLRVSFNSHNWYAHHIIWIWVTGERPKGIIDHKNRNKSDNSWLNLRDTTPENNSVNSSLSKRNTSGFKGVYSVRDKWEAKIGRIYIGTFASKEEASKAYETKAKLYYDKPESN